MARFDLLTRRWQRLSCRGHGVGGSTISPRPRAFHASWVSGEHVFVHGGEGPGGAWRTDEGDAGGGAGALGQDLNDVLLGALSRDPFADDDGGRSVEEGRIARGHGASRRRENPGMGSSGGGREPECGEAKHHPGPGPLSTLEDLWKLDVQRLEWERVRGGPVPEP